MVSFPQFLPDPFYFPTNPNLLSCFLSLENKQMPKTQINRNSVRSKRSSGQMANCGDFQHTYQSTHWHPSSLSLAIA